MKCYSIAICVHYAAPRCRAITVSTLSWPLKSRHNTPFNNTNTVLPNPHHAPRAAFPSRLADQNFRSPTVIPESPKKRLAGRGGEGRGQLRPSVYKNYDLLLEPVPFLPSFLLSFFPNTGLTYYSHLPPLFLLCPWSQAVDWTPASARTWVDPSHLVSPSRLDLAPAIHSHLFRMSGS